MRKSLFALGLIVLALGLASCGTDAEYLANQCTRAGHAAASAVHQSCVKDRLAALENDRDFVTRRLSKSMYGAR